MAGTWAMNRGWNATGDVAGRDKTVTGIASQPFRLWWTAQGQNPVACAGLLRRARGGPALVVDCQPADHRPPRDLAAFEATRRPCAQAGWEYRLVGVAMDERVSK